MRGRLDLLPQIKRGVIPEYPPEYADLLYGTPAKKDKGDEEPELKARKARKKSEPAAYLQHSNYAEAEPFESDYDLQARRSSSANRVNKLFGGKPGGSGRR